MVLAFILGINAFGLYGPQVSAAAGPDLTVQDITLAPQNPTVGDTVTITVAIRNQGTASAGSSYVACYLDSAVLDTKQIFSLGPGITVTTSFTWKAETGSHVIRAIADSTGVVTESDEANNSKTFNFSTLAPDLVITSATWSPQNPSKGDNVVFTVIIKNQGGSPSRATGITLYVDGISRGAQNVDALNPGSTVTRTFNWVALSGQHIVRAVVDESNSVTESNEANNEQSLTLSTLPPDLIIQSITWTPENPLRDSTITISASIKNQGSGQAGTCSLGYYFDSFFISTVPVPALEAGASANVTFPWIVSVASSQLKLVVDFQNNVTESDETNNEKWASLSTVSPDLIVQDLTWEPGNAGTGDVMTFKATIKNQGNGQAAASRTSYYINGEYKDYLNVPQLNAGGQAVVTFQATASGKTLVVTVDADSGNAAIETNEANNTMIRTISILQPDLIISQITWEPVNPPVGDTVVFTVTVKNQGGGKASNYNIGYYLDDALLSSESISTTNATASANVTYTWLAQNGRHNFKAVADYTGRVTESDETNNACPVTVVPLMPDLTIAAVNWSPLEAPSGSEVTFDINIQNQGTLPAGTSRVDYFIDGAVAGYDYIGSLEPGSAVMAHFSWMATDGSHEVDIIADANNQVTEIDETNNSKAVNLPPPDLVVLSIAASPQDCAVGDTVVITASIENIGSSKNQESLLALSVDGFTAASIALPPIEPGGSIEKSLEWVAERGRHTLKITADIDNTVIESDETNNEQEMEFSTMTPDLTVQGISWSTDSSLKSNEINFTIRVQNTGTGASGDYELKYSFDDDPAAIEDMPPLPAGQTAEFSFSSILSSGSHTASIVVDSPNSVIEIDEGNNESVIPFSTIAPDLVIRNMTWTPLDAAIGQEITITARVENQGTTEAVNTRLALSVDGAEVSSIDVPEIPADSTTEIAFPWTALQGTHEISVLANSDNAVMESDMTNNSKVRTISFEKPEITPKKGAVLPVVPSSDDGFLSSWWWMLLIVGALLGIGVFLSAYRASRKKY